MPRSGSTLLEQMLATQSQVEGTRELTDIPTLALQLRSGPNVGEPAQYPQAVASLERLEIEGLAARYLSRTQIYRHAGKPRFVDKMLGNFGHIGFIQLMFPRAAIIDARSEEHTSELQSLRHLVCRLLLEKKKTTTH